MVGYTLQIAWWGQIDKNCLDGDEYLDEYELLTWQQFEGMSRHPNRFWESVKQELGKIKRCLRRTPPTPAFSPELPKKENKLEYVPGFLPTYGEYVEMGCPKIIYKKDERLTIWKEAILKGWSHILDKSAPGLGKSYSVGNLTAEYMGIGQLMYLASDHRNPTTMTIERNFVDVPPRHGGLVNDPTRLTPTGRPFHVHPTNKNSNDEHAVPSNCVRHNVFRATTAKNLNLESSDSDICQGCNLLHACRGGIMEVGSGYLSQRMLALQYSQVRLHPDSTPLPHTYNYLNTGLICDEASPLFNVKKKIEVRISDLLQTVGQQIVSHLGFGDYPVGLPLTIVYKVLRDLFDTKQESLPRYGLNDSEIAKLLGASPDTLAETIRELVEHLSPNLDFLAELSDVIDTSKLSFSDQKGTKKVNKLLRDEHNHEATKQLESLPLNWLIPMLEVWAGYVAGNFTYNNGVFTIYQLDSRHRNIARAAGFNLYLDGTISKENLALKVGVPTHHILVLETEIPDYSNLEIVHAYLLFYGQFQFIA